MSQLLHPVFRPPLSAGRAPVPASAILRRGAVKRAHGALGRRLDEGWRVVRDRCFVAGNEQYRVGSIILHRNHGIALVVFSEAEYAVPDIAIRVTRNVLWQSGFGDRFPGYLPVVFAALDSTDTRAAPQRIAEIFAAEPAITIVDGGWLEEAERIFQGAPGGMDEDDAGRGPAAGAAGSPAARARRGGRSLSLTAAGLVAAAALLCGGLLTAAAFLEIAAPGRAAPGGVSRLMSEAAAEAYLNLSPGSFRREHRRLAAAGFPAADPVTGNYDRVAIDRWVDHFQTNRQRPAGNQARALQSNRKEP